MACRQREGEVRSVLDVGSNSIKLRVARRVSGGLRTLLDTTEVVGLGRGMQEGRLSEATMQSGLRVIERLAKRAEALGSRPRLVGTMALRQALNSEEFARRIQERTGLVLEIISGTEEARLSWRGALSAFADCSRPLDSPLAVFDTGGGSTEFVFGTPRSIERSFSIPLGAVSLTERFLSMDPVTESALQEALSYVDSILKAELSPVSSLSLIGLGGGVVAMASVKLGAVSFVPLKLNGLELTRADVEGQVELFASCSVEQRRAIPGLPPRRADIILASACIVRGILEALELPALTVSINGLRHGLLLEMFDSALDGKTQKNSKNLRRGRAG
ncbi:MAG: Ppx/GppA family phosphatase [Fretibacterium sp.]|nr:Ppx/GppA family phosphatase [Fretibacterium sp.]